MADDLTVIQTNAGVGAAVARGYERTIAGLASEVYRLGDGGIPYRIRRDGTIEPIERLELAPVLRRGEAAFYDATSFAGFVNQFVRAGSVIFADAIARRFTAAIDYHVPDDDGDSIGVPRWDLFRGVLPLRFTPAWDTWSKANGVAMTQEAFAQFLEDNIPDIAEPAGAALVEIARTLEAKNSVTFESHIRADNGAHRFAYVEDVNGTTRGAVTIPAELTLVLQPFEGSARYRLAARFRYRLAAKSLSLWISLVRPDDVLKAAFADQLTAIRGLVPESVPMWNGPAPIAQTPKD